MKKKIFYIEHERGCHLAMALHVIEAREDAVRELGTRTIIKNIREATEEDINWVYCMGGYVPV